MTADKVADPTIEQAARLHDVLKAMQRLEGALAGLAAAETALRGQGILLSVYPFALGQTLHTTQEAYNRTPAARALLGLTPLPTHAEEIVQMARADVEHLEDHLAQLKAWRAETELAAKARRERIESCAYALVLAKRRLAEVDPGTREQLKAWLKGFKADLSKTRDEETGIALPESEGLRQRNARDAARAYEQDPLGSLLRDDA